MDRRHIERIDNCEMGFDIDFRRVGSLRIVYRLAVRPLESEGSRWGTYSQL